MAISYRQCQAINIPSRVPSTHAFVIVPSYQSLLHHPESVLSRPPVGLSLLGRFRVPSSRVSILQCPRRFVPVASAAGDDFAVNSNPNSATSVSDDPKAQLLELVSRKDTHNRSHQIRSLLLELESRPNSRPETAMFAGFVLAGEWKLVFSTSPVAIAEGLRIRSMKQCWDAEKTTLLNSCYWSYCQADDEHNRFDACIDIACTFEFTGESALVQVTLQSHQMRLVDRDDGLQNAPLPDDLQALIQKVQRALPVDFWDPTGLMDPSTYVDPTFRISCMLGDRFRTVRSVFVRC